MARLRTRRSRGGSARALGTRAARDWAVRWAFALSALVLGYISVTGTLANVIVKAAPETAYRLAWGEGRVTAALALRNFSAAPDTNPNSQQARLAKRALQQDPTAVDALNVLALQAQLRSEGASADRLFGYSFALSRRELQPQIWTIEKAVERGDIEQALSNYDLALRTSRKAQETLFPVLASAIAEPKIRSSLLRLLATRPVWAEAFLSYASAQGRDPLATAQLLRAGAARGLQAEDAYQARVVNALLAQGLVDEAWSFYESFRPGVARNRSRDANFELSVDVPSSFDWTVGRASGLSAAILQGAGGGFLDFAAPASTRAVAVSQTQLLPPGNYRIEGLSAGIDQPERSQPYWALTCRAGAEVGRVNVPNSVESNGRFAGEFSVPSDCPVQTLALVLRASDKVSGTFGQIEQVQLVPAAQ